MKVFEISPGNWVQTKSDHRYGRIILVKDNVRKPAEIELWLPADREKRLLTIDDIEPIPITQEMMHNNRKSLLLPIESDIILYSKNRINASKSLEIVWVHQYQNFISACGFGDGSEFDVLVERETLGKDEIRRAAVESGPFTEKCTYLGANTILDAALHIDGHLMDNPADIKCDITYHTFRYNECESISVDIIQEIMLVAHARNREAFSVLKSICNNEKMFGRLANVTGNLNMKPSNYNLEFDVPNVCPVWIHNAWVDRIFEREHDGQTIEYTIHFRSSETLWRM